MALLTSQVTQPQQPVLQNQDGRPPQEMEGGETFIQRQRRLAGQQTAPSNPQPLQRTTAAPPTGSPSTPVLGNGKIPEPQVATPPPVQQPAGTNPAPQNGQVQRAEVPTAPIPVYGATTFNAGVPTSSVLPDSYQGTNITQFQGPDQRATEGLQTNLVNAILGNPQTLNPQVLAALKEKNKEAALLMERQGLQAARENAAARGFTSGAGLAGDERAIQSEAANRIITGNRDLDIAAAERNRADELAALAAAEGVLGGQVQRAGSIFQNTLAGQTAEAADSRAVSADAIARAIAGNDAERANAALRLQEQGMGADERYKQFASERSAQDAVLDRVLKQFGIDTSMITTNRGEDRADRALDLNAELGRGGLALDSRRLSEQGRQFDAGHGLNVLQFLEGQRVADNNLGLGYSQLNQQGQQNLINTILSIIR